MQIPIHGRRFTTVGALTCAVWCGCGPADRDQGRPLVVVVSGDTAGWIVPCGCASNQSGGLPRRGSYVKQLRGEAEVILADAGGAPGGTSAYDRLKFEAVLKGEMEMGIAAHNIGAPEAALGADYLRRLADRFDVPLLSANAFDAKGEPLAPPVRIAEAAGRRLALVGVLGEQYATGEIQVSPPQQAVLDALRQVAGRYDAVVVLAYLPDEKLRQLAEVLPEADLVLGGPTGQPIAPISIGPTVLASATKRGKFLARFDAPPQASSERWAGSIVELDQRFDDDARQMANLGEFYRQLAMRDFTPQQTSFGGPLPKTLPEGFSIAGSRSCRECHEQEFQAWNDSRHAHAWESLKEKGAHVDPDCQRCHATGYGLPGGFASIGRTPALIAVGCESCHGASQDHVGEPTLHTTHYAGAKNHCIACHDRENSPQFAFQEYWARIQHGETPAAGGDSKGDEATVEPGAVANSRETSEDLP